MAILVVVADSSHARILTASTRDDSLSEITDLVHSASRQAETELISDDRGSGKSPESSGGYSMGHEKDSHKQQKKIFAHELCFEVNKLIKNDNIGGIYLIASPEFTGILRQEMSKKILNLLVAKIEKNLVKQSIEDIRSHLPKRL